MADLLKEAWHRALREPTPGFFSIYAHQVREGRLDECLRELVERLPTSGPSAPKSVQGLMILRAILVLAPCLQETSFHGLMGAHLRMMASCPLPEGEAPALTPMDYASLRADVAPDMASTGLKGILAHQMEDLAFRLELGPRLLPFLRIAIEALPQELSWHRRALKRLEGFDVRPVSGDSVRVLCEGGMAEVLDHFGARIRNGASFQAILGDLAEGAARKLLEADRALQGRTSWPLVYLATLDPGMPVQWLQAAALVNLFPSEEWSSLEPEGEATLEGLEESILDAEPEKARRLSRTLLVRMEPATLLPMLAEAAASSDPMNDAGHRLLATAAAIELMPRIDPTSQAWVLWALATNLAATQTSGDRVEQAKRSWLTRA